MLNFLIFGTILGLSAGVSPGPLLTLVISHTLQFGTKEGLKITLAPILTDLPFIAVSFLIYTSLPELDLILGLISLVGAVFVAVLGVQSLLQKPVELKIEEVAPHSILKGILVNLLSPHPYIFWFSIGTPTLIKATKVNIWAAVGFAACFFVAIIFSKALIAVIVGKSRQFLKGRAYIWILRILGIALILFAGRLFYEGVVLLR
jgi:threonine/homoserine/homoserine lactone efflux protein